MRDLIYTLETFSDEFNSKITFPLNPNHFNIHRNEAADKLGKEGSCMKTLSLKSQLNKCLSVKCTLNGCVIRPKTRLEENCSFKCQKQTKNIVNQLNRK